MGDVSKFFNRIEFKCNCYNCKPYAVDAELLEVLEDVREHFDAPVYITSGWRCEKHNTNVGGAKDSKHLYGIAADFKVRNVSPIDVHGYLVERYPDCYGIGLYSSWVHLDVRPERARWYG